MGILVPEVNREGANRTEKKVGIKECVFTAAGCGKPPGNRMGQKAAAHQRGKQEDCYGL